MGDLTRNISRKEISCKCGCGFDTIDYETIKVVQSIADFYWHYIGVVVVKIHSGCRCLEYNRMVESNDTSQHIKGRAIDFSIAGVDSLEIWEAINRQYQGKYGIGQYSNFVHFDSRSTSSRW